MQPGSGQNCAAAAAGEARGFYADCWRLGMGAARRDSELEDKLLRLIRRARLPEPVIHYNVVHGDEWLGEVDLAYPQARIAIETHGYRVHSLKRVWENDQCRENDLVRAGWKLLKATHLQLEQRPRLFLEALRSLLRAPKTNNLRRRTRASLESLSESV